MILNIQSWQDTFCGRFDVTKEEMVVLKLEAGATVYKLPTRLKTRYVVVKELLEDGVGSPRHVDVFFVDATSPWVIGKSVDKKIGKQT